MISLAVLIAVFTMATVLLWKPLAGTFQKPEQFRAWVDSNGLLGRLAFIGIAMLQVIFAVIPGEPIELGAGYAFGAVEGTALCLLADVVATAMIVLFTKRFGIKLVEVFLSREKISSLKFLHNRRKLNLLIFLLFFIPGSPKDVVTYAVGLTPVKLGTILILTGIARIPSILTSTIAGNALGMKNYTAAVIVYAVTGLASLAGILIYRKMSKESVHNM